MHQRVVKSRIVSESTYNLTHIDTTTTYNTEINTTTVIKLCRQNRLTSCVHQTTLAIANVCLQCQSYVLGF